jgi:hypothetical protein
VLASDLVDAVVDQLDGVGVGEQLIAGENILEDLHYGSNASAEEADEGTEEATESGVDLVLNHRLTETGFGKKADYMTYLKDYMKKIVKYLEDNNKADQVDEFKKSINGVMKGLLGKFNDLQFFTGESMDPNGMIILVEYKEVDGEEKPVVMFFKHGLEEEKC